MSAQPIAQFRAFIPPRAPTLRELVVRAIETDAALHQALGPNSSASDTEYCRRDEAAFDARADLRAALMNLGLTKDLIDALGEVL